MLSKVLLAMQDGVGSWLFRRTPWLHGIIMSVNSCSCVLRECRRLKQSASIKQSNEEAYSFGRRSHGVDREVKAGCDLCAGELKKHKVISSFCQGGVARCRCRALEGGAGRCIGKQLPQAFL